MLPAIGFGLRSTSASIWFLGLTLTATLGDPVLLPHWLVPFGWLLVGAFALWNGWALVLMAKNRTAVLPGGPTRIVLDRGPFRVSRNPLHLGLLALHAGIALLWPSFWALVAVPVSAGLLLWGAILPEEHPGSRKPEGPWVAHATNDPLSSPVAMTTARLTP